MADTAEDSVVLANTKNLGDAPAMAMSTLYQGMAQAAVLAAQNAVANQANQMAQNNAATVMGVNKLLNLDPTESVSLLKSMSGNDLAQQLAQLVSGLAAGQEASKNAGNTPPVTP